MTSAQWNRRKRRYFQECSRAYAHYTLESWKEIILEGVHEPGFKDIEQILYYIREAE